MKVVLLRNVKGVGHVGETKEVADGYARNSLIPAGLAEIATSGSLRRVNEAVAAQDNKRAKGLRQLEDMAKRLTGLVLEFTEKPAPSGKFYVGVNAQRVAAALAERGITVDRQGIDLPHAIKEAGEYNVAVNLGYGIHARLRIKVTPGP